MTHRRINLLFLFLGILVVCGILFGAFLFFRKNPPMFLATTVSIAKEKQIDPKEPVVINFSKTILAKDYRDSFKLSPSESVILEWKNKNKKLIITPKEFWKPEQEYQISLSDFRNKFFYKTKKKDFTFSTINYPKVETFYPADGAKDIRLGIEDPMTVHFDKSIKDFWIKAELKPHSDIEYQYNTERKQFKFLPKNEIEAGQEYLAEIYIKYIDDDDSNYKKIYEGGFETLPANPESWDSNFELRLAQAKKFTRPKILKGRYIDVNLEIQIMTIFENGKIIDSFLISSGQRGMDTPKGEMQIYNKHPRPWSGKYGLYMPYWMAIKSDGLFGIHELPEWPGGYKEGENHLGTPVSHGCIRLGVGGAQKVYEWAEVGTKVIIY